MTANGWQYSYKQIEEGCKNKRVAFPERVQTRLNIMIKAEQNRIDLSQTNKFGEFISPAEVALECLKLILVS